MTERPLTSDCPYCRGALSVSAMYCSACRAEVHGRFDRPMLARLSAEDQELLEQYLLAGFNIKTLEKRSGMGYAAIRSRLDRLIARYERLRAEEKDDTLEREKARVLRQMAAGEISAAEAVEKIENLRLDNENHRQGE